MYKAKGDFSAKILICKTIQKYTVYIQYLLLV